MLDLRLPDFINSRRAIAEGLNSRRKRAGYIILLAGSKKQKGIRRLYPITTSPNYREQTDSSFQI